MLLVGALGALMLFGAEISVLAGEPTAINPPAAGGPLTELPLPKPQTADNAVVSTGEEGPTDETAAGGEWMEATASVNVRNIPAREGELLGTLAAGQQVLALGYGESGWYAIAYGDGVGYASGSYLRPTAKETAGPADSEGGAQTVPAAPVSARIPTEEGIYPGTPLVLIGDSRFVQMREAVGPTPWVWIAESGKGYDWFVENGLDRADNVIGTGTRVIVNLGVNDVRNADKYIALFNQKAAEWTMRGAVVYYSAANPVWTNPYVTKEQVEAFNQKLQANLAPYILWIDSYHYLQSTGCRIVDGLHYDTPTYVNLYTYYMGICFQDSMPVG